jgi:hypothetical protein
MGIPHPRTPTGECTRTAQNSSCSSPAQLFCSASCGSSSRSRPRLEEGEPSARLRLPGEPAPAKDTARLIDQSNAAVSEARFASYRQGILCATTPRRRTRLRRRVRRCGVVCDRPRTLTRSLRDRTRRAILRPCCPYLSVGGWGRLGGSDLGVRLAPAPAVFPRLLSKRPYSAWRERGTRETKNPAEAGLFFGADDGTRTHDLLHGKQML